MIKSKNGKVELNGDIDKLGADLTCIIRSLRGAVSQVVSPEFAEELIENAVKVSKLSREELKKHIEEMRDQHGKS